MIAKRGSFDFCNAPVLNSAQQVQGNWQCPFFFNQVQDCFENVKNWNFTLNVIQDSLDAGIAIDEAMAFSLLGGTAGPGGALAGLSIGLSAFLASAGSNISNSGTTHRVGYCTEMVPTNAVYDATGTYKLQARANTYYIYIEGTNDVGLMNGSQIVIPGKKFLSQTGSGGVLTMSGMPNKPVTASVVNRGVRDIYAANLCLVMIDWGAVVRQQVGSKQGLGGILYYPEVQLLWWGGGYLLATDVTLIAGAGTILGGITVGESEGVITNINCATAAGPPVGTPSVFGQINPNERYDALEWDITIASNVFLGESYPAFVELGGITFDYMATGEAMTLGASPVQGVFYKGQQIPFGVSEDQKTLTAYLTDTIGGDYLTFKTTNGYAFTTREKI